jgi:hypothetical protein
LCLSALCGADTFVVNPDGTGDYLTITSAATWVPDGSTIAIADGDYSESITLVGRTLTIEPLLEGGTVHWLLPAGATDWAALHATACTLSVNDIVFDGVDATHVDKTGIFIGGGVCSISGVTATNFKIGSVVQIGSGHGCIMLNTRFVENTSGIVLSIGGASGPVMQLSGCTFASNGTTASSSMGSGLRVGGTGPGEIMLYGCTFSGNSAFIGGAILHDAQAELSMESCVISGNVAENRAGGVLLNNVGGTPIAMTSCTFVGNSVLSGVGGGAIFLDGDSAEVQTCLITDCLFQGNVAWSLGGAIHIQPNAPSSNEYLIQGCSFIDNSATVGGGIYVVPGVYDPVGIQDSYFCSNDPDHVDATWADLGGNLFVDTCSQGACCHPSGVDWACSNATHGACITLGGTFAGVGVDCADIDCDGPSLGACCLAGLCVEIQQAACEALLGEWNGGEICIDVTCDGGTGSSGTPCCIDGTCILLDAADCASVGGTAHVDEASCDDVICAAYCAEDVNGDGEVNVDDLLLIIGAWGICP